MEVLVNDNDTLVVVARLGPSVNDPGGECSGIANVYRIVAQGSTLILVPLSPSGYQVSRSEMDDVQRRSV